MGHLCLPHPEQGQSYPHFSREEGPAEPDDQPGLVGNCSEGVTETKHLVLLIVAIETIDLYRDNG